MMIGAISCHMEVLSNCKHLLKFLNLCNENGVRIKNVKIPNLIVFCGFATPMVYELIMTVLMGTVENIDAEKMPILMCVAMSYLQAILTYMSMAKTNRFTIATIEHMQQIIDKSE